MPAELSGSNILVGAAGTAMPAQTTATLTTEPELVETIVKNANAPIKRSGDLQWNISAEGKLRDDAGKAGLSNGEVALKADLDLTDDGTETTEIIPGLQSVTLSLDQELEQVPPGIDQPTGWRFFSPQELDWTLEMEGHYYDPESNDVYDALYQKPRNGEVIAGTLEVFGLTFNGDLAVDSIEREADTDGPGMVSFSFGGSDLLTKSGSSEAPISELLTSYFDQQTVPSFFRPMQSGNPQTGTTSWKGDAWLSTAELTLERDAYPNFSYEVQGDGALNRVTQ